MSGYDKSIIILIGLKYTTPTIASTPTNILPAINIYYADPFKTSKDSWSTFCVSGSMLMTFYNGALIHIQSSGLH
ncbi:hypothetical protein IEQ34_001636 [Dendrobium chrysotoxum]|uniref:Uncharacterized protein n=1 Tax=Dendrobium chrysotoxum TaxID=161865 RepID=A0AAV7HR58_DENCH|nr:hypothetical protein IEQ34_001636 [Dendrobium chrysotoxum]